MLQLSRTFLLCLQLAGKDGWDQKSVSQSTYAGKRWSWDAACSKGMKGKKKEDCFELPLGVGGIRLKTVLVSVVGVGESPVPLFVAK